MLAAAGALLSLTVPPSARAWFLRRPAVLPGAGFGAGPSFAPEPVVPATERRPTGS